ncbi:enolase C-terminal domain-like protein [Chthonobacter rhizosphaerae]|uniref:enolase C-terminal domain-like protein n=1 Tax=Chthonobacter rhizosphaerae TaxID=2735553 RepID=UPI0015EED1D3|nr:enolase C-terminal domain-like protein [Chthonobacter rhizosphaerae]
MGTDLPIVRLVDAAVFERPVSLRLPFRFGAVTLREARQAFLRVRIEDGAGRTGFGHAAELMVPKWFDKAPDLSNADNEAQLRRSLALAIEAMSAAGPGTAFGLHAAVEAPLHAVAAGEDLPGLVASFGLALVDRAILDALCRLDGVAVADALRANRPGMDARTAPDLAGFDLDGFLGRLDPADSLKARHTVGFADALTEAEVDPGARIGDGLPESLEAAIGTYGLDRFKLKLTGDPMRDVSRVTSIAAVLDRLPDYRVTLDGNEQYPDADTLVDFLDRLAAEPRAARLRANLLFVEQPIARAVALSRPVTAAADRVALEIDESDGGMEAFRTAKALGYTGVSSKSCKGLYRSLLNAARVAAWNAEAGDGRFFLSAEDLTTQAGIAVQQDLVLAALVGAGHVERNGHHYVDGMQGAGAGEAAAFLDHHGDLYRAGPGGRPRLAIEGGRIAFGSALRAPGLGVAGPAAEAAFAALRA